MKRVLVLFFMMGCYASYHSYSGFGAIINNQDFGNILDLHYDPITKMLIVVGQAALDNTSLLVQYDSRGNVKKKIQFAQNTFYFESHPQVLWEDGCFYLPLYTSAIDPQVGYVKKYDYNLNLIEAFGNNGTMAIADPDFGHSAACVAKYNDSYYVGGMVRDDKNGPTTSGYYVAQFNSTTGAIIQAFRQENFLPGAGSLVNYLLMFDNGFAVIKDINNAIFGLNLHADTGFITTTPIGAVGSICKCDDLSFFFYAGGNGLGHANRNIYYYIVDPIQKTVTMENNFAGEGALAVNTTNVVNDQNINSYIYRLITLNKQLLLIGSFSVVNGGEVFPGRYPLLMVYSIKDLLAPKLDTSFFGKGFWTYTNTQNYDHPEKYISVADSTTLRSNSMIFGYSSYLFHIYNMHDESISERLLSDVFIPLVS